VKAIRVHSHGGPDALRLEELPDPRPARGEALVQVEAAGVNFIEVYQRKGQYAMNLPYTPGSEGAGTVVAVGDHVSSVKVGDRVVSQSLRGSYAEFALAPAERLISIPDGVAPKVAAAAMLQGLTAHYLVNSTYPLQPGDWCLVHAAAGGVGLLLCQLARMRGALAIGTVSNEEKARLARDAGAHATINYISQDFVAEVKRLTDGKGVKVVYDSVGATTFPGSLNSLAPRGLLALFGQSSGPVPPFDPQILNQKGSLFLTRPTLAHYVATREELEDRATELFQWIRTGKLKVRIHAEYSLSDAPKAHSIIESRGTTGKVILIPGSV
jgi:NADPH2:quinone reductase